MTHPDTQRLIAKLTSGRRSGENDCELVRRHERRLCVFAFLSGCVLLPIVLVGFFLSGRSIEVLLIWVVVASWQVYLWLRCRHVRRLFEHETAA